MAARKHDAWLYGFGGTTEVLELATESHSDQDGHARSSFNSNWRNQVRVATPEIDSRSAMNNRSVQSIKFCVT